MSQKSKTGAPLTVDNASIGDRVIVTNGSIYYGEEAVVIALGPNHVSVKFDNRIDPVRLTYSRLSMTLPETDVSALAREIDCMIDRRGHGNQGVEFIYVTNATYCALLDTLPDSVPVESKAFLYRGAKIAAVKPNWLKSENRSLRYGEAVYLNMFGNVIDLDSLCDTNTQEDDSTSPFMEQQLKRMKSADWNF